MSYIDGNLLLCGSSIDETRLVSQGDFTLVYQGSTLKYAFFSDLHVLQTSGSGGALFWSTFQNLPSRIFGAVLFGRL